MVFCLFFTRNIKFKSSLKEWPFKLQFIFINFTKKIKYFTKKIFGNFLLPKSKNFLPKRFLVIFFLPKSKKFFGNFLLPKSNVFLPKNFLVIFFLPKIKKILPKNFLVIFFYQKAMFLYQKIFW